MIIWVNFFKGWKFQEIYTFLNNFFSSKNLKVRILKKLKHHSLVKKVR